MALAATRVVGAGLVSKTGWTVTGGEAGGEAALTVVSVRRATAPRSQGRKNVTRADNFVMNPLLA